MVEIRVTSRQRVQSVDITNEIVTVVRGKSGRLLHIYTPHTTCGIIINENADPCVMEDVTNALNRMVPRDYPYTHLEGNADAHVKAILTGCAVTVPFSKGSPVLGTWQGIFLMEFDGPRERKVFVTLID